MFKNGPRATAEICLLTMVLIGGFGVFQWCQEWWVATATAGATATTMVSEDAIQQFISMRRENQAE